MKKIKLMFNLFLMSCMLSFMTYGWSSTGAYEDFYGTSGCRLLLCLQNPNGPNAVSECNQDVDAFYAEIAAAVYGKNPDIPICISDENVSSPLSMDQMIALGGNNNKAEIQKQVSDRVSSYPGANKKAKKKAKKKLNDMFAQ